MSALLEWSPLLPPAIIVLMASLAIIILIIARRKKIPDLYVRGLSFFLFCLIFSNPIMLHEVRQRLPNKMVVVVDESPSESIAKRDETADKILTYIKSLRLQAEPIIIRAGRDPASQKNQNTSLFTELRNNLMNIPVEQVSGTVLITDGQVHDVPDNLGALEKLGPFNVILTGRKDEFDRKITVVEAPKYGLVNQDISLKVKVEDSGTAPPTPIVLNILQDGKPAGQYTVQAGAVQEYPFKISHAGQNIFEFSVTTEKNELTGANNTAAVIVNGIRDRLRVLLVSGMPHMGERAWRDLLKSDPSIDLIHFNILRSLKSIDQTPPREMSLIAFPVEELFEKKIHDFDLIIFDKYVQYGFLQPQYFVNIASYVKNGGAFLMAMGSDQPEQSLFATAVGDILPVEPKSEETSILSGPYLPQLTDIGKTHPVTADLQAGKNPWGSWFGQTDVNQTKGQVLMTGAEGRPLLILDKVSDGRVAVLTSDNIWLWSKGMHGGGPYTELLRNVAHWLMREPELEEDYIKTEVKGNMITISEHDQSDGKTDVTMIRPDGHEEIISLSTREQAWNVARVVADQNGIYRFSNSNRTAFAVLGTAASQEFSDVHTTGEKLQPLVDKTKGRILWYPEMPHFTRSDLRLKDHMAYNITSIDSAPILPNWLSMLIIFGTLTCVWYSEGKIRKPR
ncbi:MAG: hypothetical protein HY052_03160 [Proteobacteria bacterium]|nr:hypothetical protein [Pseudomonadota bacterium]